MSEIAIVEPQVFQISEINPIKKLELCGRVCYKSEDKISEGSGERLIKSIIKRGHTSVLEHFRIEISSDRWEEFPLLGKKNEEFEFDLDSRQYRRFLEKTSKKCVVGNVRAWRYYLKSIGDGPKQELLNTLSGKFPEFFGDLADFETSGSGDFEFREPGDYKTLRIITDRGVSHEIVRHRSFSFSQESTRYCNYNNLPMQFIRPIPFSWATNPTAGAYMIWEKSCHQCSDNYSEMIEVGCTPQEARSVLNNSLKTEIVMTGTYHQWDAFLKLRIAKDAHPQMQITASQIAANL